MANRRIGMNVFIVLTFFIIRSSSRCSCIQQRFTFISFCCGLFFKNVNSLNFLRKETLTEYWIHWSFSLHWNPVQFINKDVISTDLLPISKNLPDFFSSPVKWKSQWNFRYMTNSFECVNVIMGTYVSCASLHLSDDQHQNWH